MINPSPRLLFRPIALLMLLVQVTNGTDFAGADLDGIVFNATDIIEGQLVDYAVIVTTVQQRHLHVGDRIVIFTGTTTTPCSISTKRREWLMTSVI